MIDPQSPQRTVPSYQRRNVTLDAKGWVQTANRMAGQFAQDTPIRAVAVEAVRGLPNVRKDGPGHIATWVRSHCEYVLEAGEVLQGPYTTLPSGQLAGFGFRGIGAGDCDDLVILWACLCRSIGLQARFVGIGPDGGDGFFHAVGLCDGRLYELSRDDRYGAKPRGVTMQGLPLGSYGYTYDVESSTGRIVRNLPEMHPGYPPIPSWAPDATYVPGGRIGPPSTWMAGPCCGRLTMSGMSGISDSEVDDALGYLSDLRAKASEEDIDLDSLDLGGIADDVGDLAGTANDVRKVTAAAAQALNLAPGVGTVAAAVILVGVGAWGAINARKRRRDAEGSNNDFRDAKSAIRDLFTQAGTEQSHYVWYRISELIPSMDGTYGTTGDPARSRSGNRHIWVAGLGNFDDVDKFVGMTWSNGNTKNRFGLADVFWKRGFLGLGAGARWGKIDTYMQAYAEETKALSGILADLPDTLHRKAMLKSMFRDHLRAQWSNGAYGFFDGVPFYEELVGGGDGGSGGGGGAGGGTGAGLGIGVLALGAAALYFATKG